MARINNLPTNADRVVCPTCKECSIFETFGRHIGKKSFLYFVCQDCKSIWRGKSHCIK